MYDLERFYFLPKALEIPFECAYPNQAVASLLEMNIKESGLILLTPEHGSGAFDLDMSIYKVLKCVGGFYVCIKKRIWISDSVNI